MLADQPQSLLTPEQASTRGVWQCEAKQLLGPACEPQPEGASLIDVIQVILTKAYHRHQLGACLQGNAHKALALGQHLGARVQKCSSFVCKSE